ncbi:MAG: endopeptidase La [Thermodesulfobacteriota bacterium]|nr:endopeptidase La [Thermodesulfobacteriota bacterium]
MIQIPKLFKQNGETDPALTLPLLPLRDIVVFPYMVVPLFIGRTKSINALSAAMEGDKKIFLAAQTQPGIDNPGKNDIKKIGTVGSILQMLRLSDGTVKALVEGHTRASISAFITNDDYFMVDLAVVPEADVSPPQAEALCRTVHQSFENYAQHNKETITKEIASNIAAISGPSQLADTIAAHIPFKIETKQALLEETSLESRLTRLSGLIDAEIEISGMEQKIKHRIKKQMEKNQRNYYLNEQMRAIKKEMGGGDEAGQELEELEKRVKRKKMSKEGAKKVRQELKKLKNTTQMSAEYTVIRNYIDWLISLPWYNKSKLRHDIVEAEGILDTDHYGLEKPKERILEYLAVQSLVKKVKGPILCLVGPPGVGKTSLAQSVARATSRKFVRISLGGVRDEAEIRGHRRTYIGSMPGKIIQALKKTNVNNPVFCLDEVDKMSMDFRGDPSAALLEVLDPEQNYAFSDHYLDVDYDLSDILFITTANSLHSIPLPLQDRMEIIKLPGYTEHEKYNIATQFLIPKQLKANGVEDYNISFSKNSLYTIIQQYTREAGVRNLERNISTICRKIAREIAKTTNGHKGFRITASSIAKHLGPPQYRHGQMEESDHIGLVTGLAWTSVGGELLSIETAIMPGKGELTITGKLGDVMRESAQAALSYVRSRSDTFEIDNKFHENLDIHIHVPEGAIPKDGPSAGVSMCTSLVSALTKKPVYRNIAMTGEITLRGRVLPVGGIRDKILAAHRGGINKVIIPKDCEKDLVDIPSTIARKLDIVLSEHMDEILDQALKTDEASETNVDEMPAVMAAGQTGQEKNISLK